MLASVRNQGDIELPKPYAIELPTFTIEKLLNRRPASNDNLSAPSSSVCCQTSEEGIPPKQAFT